jgi:GGDEF domain-containing protein
MCAGVQNVLAFPPIVQITIEQEIKDYYLIPGVSIVVNLLLLAMAANRNAQARGLSELSRFLQSCADLAEAAGLTLTRAFRWGDKTFVDTFEPGERAARLRQPFHQPFEIGSASCAHLQSAYASEHNNNTIQCLPLMAYGDLLGVVVLEADGASEPQESIELEGSRRFALEQVGLSIGNLKFSIGLAQFPAQGGTIEALLLAADKAMYEAKSAGRNRVVVAS